MSFSVSGKTAIVTGAANGIGLAVARHLADKGANVMCADANEKSLRENLGDEPEDGSLRIFAGDLRQRLTIANLVSATIDAFDRVDILVNASRQVLPTEALDPEDTSVMALLEQNLNTALNLSQQVAEEARKFFEGRVYQTVIPRNVRLSEAPSFGMPVVQYDPTCIGAKCYLDLAEEVPSLQQETVTHE